jgi:hypothetical protein
MDTTDYAIDITTRNPTGVAGQIYIKEISKFDTIVVPTASTLPGDTVKITDDHTFPADPGTDGWQILTAHENTPELEVEEVGEDGSRMKKFSLKAFHPNWSAALEEETSYDKRYLVLFRRPSDGTTKLYQLGTEETGAKMMSGLESGKTREGGRFGHPVVIEATQPVLFEYTGAVTRPSA